MVDDRSGKPDRLSPAGYSKSDYDRSWSSQECKSGAAAHDRSGKLLGMRCNKFVLIMKTLFSTEMCIHDGSGQNDGQGNGVPKACQEQAAADSRGSRTCVCANTFCPGVAHAGEEG